MRAGEQAQEVLKKVEQMTDLEPHRALRRREDRARTTTAPT